MHLDLRTLLHKAYLFVIDTLFPLFCLICGTPGTQLCRQCLDLFPRRLRQRCPTCIKKTTPHGEVCFACIGDRALDGLFAAAHYRSPLISTSIHTFKYRFIPTLAEPLGSWLAERVREAELPLPDALIPVPLHPRRLRFRGFNQSSLLAQRIAELLAPGLALPVWEDALHRTRYTKPQMQTETREERLHNLQGAFTLNQQYSSLVQGTSVWLIDDIATTGTTLEECAKVLKASGVKYVFGIVVAR